MNYLEFAFKGRKYARNLVLFCQSFWNIKKILKICKKLRILVISSSQWNMSLGNIFWVIWRKVMHTREAHDFWGLYKNMNCAFPLTMITPCISFSRKSSFMIEKKFSRSKYTVFKNFLSCLFKENLARTTTKTSQKPLKIKLRWISCFDPPKKAMSVIFFRLLSFCFDMLGLSLKC